MTFHPKADARDARFYRWFAAESPATAATLGSCTDCGHPLSMTPVQSAHRDVPNVCAACFPRRLEQADTLLDALRPALKDDRASRIEAAYAVLVHIEGLTPEAARRYLREALP